MFLNYFHGTLGGICRVEFWQPQKARVPRWLNRQYTSSCCSLTLILLAWSVCGSPKSRNGAHPNLALLLCCSRTLLKTLREKVNELEVAGSWRPWGHFCFHQFVTLMNSHDILLPDSFYRTAECKEGRERRGESNEEVQ